MDRLVLFLRTLRRMLGARHGASALAMGLVLLVGCQTRDTYQLGRGPGATDGSVSGGDASEGSDGGSAPDLGVRDAGQTDSGVPLQCWQLSERECLRTRRCAASYCDDCGGGSVYQGCFGPNEDPPACDPCSILCHSLNEETCVQESGRCRADYCPGCEGARFFVMCSQINAPPISCPRPYCPCEGLDEMSCAAHPDCHRVFWPSFACGCPTPGCCTFFDHCGHGALANCDTSQALCDAAEPPCEGPYVVAVRDICYEGCVLAEDCR